MIRQEGMILSPYIDLYDIIIPKDHELRQLNELVDFSFVDDLLKHTYTSNNGRPGYRPQVMFKYLMLKRMYELSDRDVVGHQIKCTKKIKLNAKRNNVKFNSIQII